MTAPDAVRAEYRLGYWEGSALGKAHLQDQRSALVSETVVQLENWVRTSAVPLSRAFALGNLRGYRHATWEVR